MIPFINLNDHFKKHKLDTKTVGPLDYFLKANRAFTNADTAFVQPGKRNALKIVNPKTKEVIVYNPIIDRILTYYIRRNILENKK